MKRCPYCGEKIQASANECEHCGRTLRKQKTSTSDKSGLTNINTWQEKSVPAWVMILVVGFMLFCVWLVFYTASTRNQPKAPPDENSHRMPVEENLVPDELMVLRSTPTLRLFQSFNTNRL